MADVQVSVPHSTTPEDARARIGEFEAMMSKYHVKSKWSGNTAKLKGPGVSGSIAIGDSSVDVQIKLGMLAKAAGIDPKRLEGSIRKRLEAAFG